MSHVWTQLDPIATCQGAKVSTLQVGVGKGSCEGGRGLLEGGLNHAEVSTVLWLQVSAEVSVPSSYGRRCRAEAVTGATCS